MGIYVFDARFLLERLSKDAGINESSHDFGKDVVPSAISGGKVFAYPFRDLNDPQRQGYWRDVGTVDAFWKGNLELTAVLPELNLYDTQWPIWTLQEQVPPAKFVFDDEEMRGSAVDSLISGGCIVAGSSVHNSVMFVNACVERGTRVDSSLLLPGVRVGRNCTISRAIIDEGCVIPDGTQIGRNRELDRKLYHVSEGGVTLVTREMLES
jgi:glucose-1-phosphate adenylyltransferase